MSRHLFRSIPQVPIEELRLDIHNPRIRHGVDQNDCIARILHDRTNFLNLLKDIATNGISPEHILISSNADKEWVVRDGNRRITAIKLLNSSELAQPDAGLEQVVSRIAQTCNGNVPTKIDCLACDDESVILAYLERKHTGENQGIGQVNWSALLKSLFNLQLGVTDQNRRAAQLVLWVEERGLRVEDEFPLTTLTRVLSSETLNLLGFGIQNDNLTPIFPENQSYALAARVIMDVASKRINVQRDGSEGSIYEPEAQLSYIRKVREELGPPLSSSNGQNGADIIHSGATQDTEPTSSLGASQESKTGTDNSTADNNDFQTSANTKSEGSGRRPPAPLTPSWERPHLFVRAHPGFGVPAGHQKIGDAITELRRLKVKETPLAVSMVFRTLIELSEQHYRQISNLKDKDAFHKNIAAAADHMKDAGLLSEAQHAVVMTRTRDDGGMLHVKTLHGYVHSEHFHPTYQMLNSLWNEIGCFVAACWAK